MTDTSLPELPQLHRNVYRGAIRMAQAAGEAAHEAGVSREVVELINVRVSQINGCARCLSVHVPKALEVGVSAAKLHLLPTWREASVFTEFERAALEIAELTTLLPTHVARSAHQIGQDAGLTDEQITVSPMLRDWSCSKTARHMSPITSAEP